MSQFWLIRAQMIIGCLASTAIVLVFPFTVFGQFHSFQFPVHIDEIVRQVDDGAFESAHKLLVEVDSTEWADTDERRAQFYFIRGYYNLFHTGKMKSLGDFVNAGKIYNLLGELRMVHLVDVYMVIDLYVKSQWVESKRRAHEMQEEIPKKEDELHAILYNILSACYCGSPPDTSRGVDYGNRAIKYYRAKENHRRLISIYGILAACYSGSGRHEKRMAYIDSALYEAKLIDHEKQIAFLNIRKARAFQEQGLFAAALKELDQAEDYFSQYPTEQGQANWINTIRSQVFAQMNDYKGAYEVLENNRVRSIKERSKEIDNQINQLMIKYETAQKEHEIAIQKLEIENNDQRIKNQKVIGVALILFLLTFFGIVFWRNKQRHLDRRRQDSINHQKKLLTHTVTSVEAERKRIAQDLHDGIGQKLTGLKMAWQQLSVEQTRALNQPLSQLTAILNETTAEVRQISHQLMPAALRKLGLVPAIEDCLEQTLRPARISYSFDHLGLDQRFDEVVEVGIYRVVQELLNNIIKHAEAKNITIEFYKTTDNLVFVLNEDGRGFDVEIERNSGNGLHNMESRIKSLDGMIEFEQNGVGGMCTSFRVPIK